MSSIQKRRDGLNLIKQLIAKSGKCPKCGHYLTIKHEEHGLGGYFHFIVKKKCVNNYFGCDYEKDISADFNKAIKATVPEKVTSTGTLGSYKESERYNDILNEVKSSLDEKNKLGYPNTPYSGPYLGTIIQKSKKEEEFEIMLKRTGAGRRVK